MSTSRNHETAMSKREEHLGETTPVSESIGMNFGSSDRTIETDQEELLTLKLLRQAINSQNPNDPVMKDFAEYVLPNLLQITIGHTAKGGAFFEERDRHGEQIRRDNAADQSLNTHLLNGLFPANLIERRLQTLDTTIRRLVKERERRLLISAFILHDFEKFPGVPPDCRKLSIQEQRQIITQLILSLGLNQFLNPENPEAYLDYLDDLLCLADNAQRRWDTNWNFSIHGGLDPLLKDRTLKALADLTCLADSLASIVKHPQDAEHYKLKELIHNLSDGQLVFTYHSIAENRGVLTNICNNAVVNAYTNLNNPDITHYTPLLYLPTGVIYLKTRDAPMVSKAKIPDQVVETICSLCARQLMDRQVGFGRDGKGMKFAEYYPLFFHLEGLMQVSLRATLRILTPMKGSVAASRSSNLSRFQQQNVLSSDYDFSFEDDHRIDQLAEFGDLVGRKIWGEKVDLIEGLRKKNKQLAPLPPEFDSSEGIVIAVAKYWDLGHCLPQIMEINRINESLKEHKLTGNTGGVPYAWYFLAAQYLKQNPGIEDIRPVGEDLITYLVGILQPILDLYPLPDGWSDLKAWVDRVVMVPGQGVSSTEGSMPQLFLDELNRYGAAKKSGRGKQLICSISHSAYTVTEQMESAVLFTPQVYTNKQMLGGSNAKRNISSIAGTEMMLRQILMNQTQASGKKFEDGKYRYLYFYPTYYFTPETNRFLQRAYTQIAQTRFGTQIRNHFIPKEGSPNLSKAHYQQVDSFLLDEDLDPEKDRSFKLRYPEDQPMTFFFIALPPGRDSTDTESWIMPSWLALAFPLILDVKTVVSESPIPPFTDGAEFEETVFLDSAPHAFRTLIGRDRLRLNNILGGWIDSADIHHPSPLNALTAAYTIHMDVNARPGKSSYEYHWGEFTKLARDLETSPLYVFSYLNRWARQQSSDTISMRKIKLYAHWLYPCFDPYVTFDPTQEKLIMSEHNGSPLNHPQKLTDLYRQFYRASKRYNPKSNAVLKPIDVAKDTILNADPSFRQETLVIAVAAEVAKLMDRVRSSTAEGRWVLRQREEERQVVLAFARYFVMDVFEDTFAGDRARLAGRQINLIRDTCEFLYRLADDQENQDRAKTDEEIPIPDSDQEQE